MPNKKKKEFAPGIPLSRPREPVPKIDNIADWAIAIQKHTTRKGKRTHFDLRLSPPGSGKAYSWAIPKAQLPGPGKKVMAVETFVHRADYMPFTGTIGQGYGQGTVERELLDKAEILKAGPDKIMFNLYQGRTPQEYAMIRTKGDSWVLLNRTLTDKHRLASDIKKSKYKTLEVQDVDFQGKHKDLIASPKLDGAFGSIVVDRQKVYAFSNKKKPGETYSLIPYHHKIPGLLEARPDASMNGTVLQSELIARKGNRVANANQVAGILNANVRKSRELQNKHGKLEAQVFNITRYKGKDVSDLPYSERKHLIRQAIKQIPILKEMPTEHVNQQGLLDKILAHKHPLTREGVVLIDPKKNLMYKVKARKEFDVYIRQINPGTGKYKNSAGSFSYSWTPGGQIVGTVGTGQGFTDRTRSDMLKHPGKYVGKVAKVYSPEQYASKALRAPSFLELHPEKNIVG